MCKLLNLSVGYGCSLLVSCSLLTMHIACFETELQYFLPEIYCFFFPLSIRDIAFYLCEWVNVCSFVLFSILMLLNKNIGLSLRFYLISCCLMNVVLVVFFKFSNTMFGFVVYLKFSWYFFMFIENASGQNKTKKNEFSPKYTYE